MYKPLLTVLLMLASAGASARGAKPCETPVFPPYSATTESALQVEKQVLQWRACHGMNARRTDAAHAARINDEVEDNLQKWADATRVYLNRQRSAYQPYEQAQRAQQTELLTRLMPARASYSTERR